MKMGRERLMAAERSSRRVLLRAEVVDGARRTVAHTLELSASSAQVELDRPPPVNTWVQLLLSFPNLLGPIELSGRVVSHHAPTAPGDPPTTTVELVFRDLQERQDLEALLERYDSARTASSRRSARVLVIDDSVLIRDIFSYGFRKYFRAHKKEVVVDLAGDANEAWELLRQRRYDIVILDHFLPGESGAELVARVRKKPELVGLPVIGISVGGSEAREAMILAGADLFLNKPIDLRDLFSTLDLLTAETVQS
jgi:CheY-like chemotaxis protein